MTINKTNSLLQRGIASLADRRPLKYEGTGEAEPMARREVQSEITGRVWKIEAQPGERVAVVIDVNDLRKIFWPKLDVQRFQFLQLVGGKVVPGDYCGNRCEKIARVERGR